MQYSRAEHVATLDLRRARSLFTRLQSLTSTARQGRLALIAGTPSRSTDDVMQVRTSDGDAFALPFFPKPVAFILVGPQARLLRTTRACSRLLVQIVMF
jgi:hypothetical protein